MPKRTNKSAQQDPAMASWLRGRQMVASHPLFMRLAERAHLEQWGRDEQHHPAWIEVTEPWRVDIIAR